jgi:hypothetical protein
LDAGMLYLLLLIYDALYFLDKVVEVPFEEAACQFGAVNLSLYLHHAHLIHEVLHVSPDEAFLIAGFIHFGGKIPVFLIF